MPVISIYPNPVNAGTVADIYVAKSMKISERIVNMSAQVMQTKQWIIQSGRNVIPLDIPTKYPSGHYYIEMLNDDKQRIFIQQLVKE
jgi:hypothetical protein